MSWSARAIICSGCCAYSYDVNLNDETERVVLGTLRAAERGVRVRLLYNVDRRPPGAVAPPPPKTRPEEIEALPFETCGVPGWPDLMHHKYVVRDGARRVDGIDELDGRLVVARGERDRRRRLAQRSRRATPRTSSSSGRRSGCGAPAGSSTASSRRRPRLVLAEARRSSSRTGSRTRSASAERRDPDRVAGASRPGRSSARSPRSIGGRRRRPRRRRRRDAGATGASHSGRQNPIQTWKAPALRTALAAAPFSGKRSTPYAPGLRARLHAREGDRLRRHRLRRELQPLPLRRDERRERARDRGRRARRPAGRVHRRGARALSRRSSCPCACESQTATVAGP